MKAWWITDTDSQHNLAVETGLYKNRLGPDVLLWQNKPSVFIGRNQSPWHEVQLQNALKDNIPIVRRFSGGGAVYHDLGNLNISFLHSASKSAQFEGVMKTFSHLGIPAVLGPRGEITVEGCKISGTAYYYYRGRWLHHLTLLFTSDLDKLWTYLRKAPIAVNSKAVASVRQQVANISDLYPHVTMQRFVDAFTEISEGGCSKATINELLHQFNREDKACFLDAQAEILHQVKSWEWIYGNTPDFSYETVFLERDLRLSIKQGKVASIEIADQGDGTDLFIDRLQRPFMMEDWQSSRAYNSTLI